MNGESTANQHSEFSPRKFILQVQGMSRYLFSKTLLIIGFAVACGAAAAFYSLSKDPIYEAEISFVLDEGLTEQSHGGNSLATVADQLGIGFPIDAGAVFSSPTNIVELMQSRLLVEKTLRSKINIDGKSLLFADFFLDSLKFREKWLKNVPGKNWDFNAKKKSRNDTLLEGGLIRNMYNFLTKSCIKTQAKGKGTTIIAVTCSTENELFSKYFLEALLDNVTQYYIESKTLRSKINLDIVQKRTDSIRIAFSSALYGKAYFSDANINPIRQTAQVSGEKQQTDVQILRTSYIELVKSLETAKTSLMRDTPLIQYLDFPILPLKKTNSSWIKYFLVFFVVGAILMSLYFAMRRGYRFIMQQ